MFTACGAHLHPTIRIGVSALTGGAREWLGGAES